MKYCLSILTLTILFLSSCKDDPQLINVEVDFFTDHDQWIIVPATFDTITEQVLVKEAHNEGGIFETITEQVLVRDAYTVYQIQDTATINLPTNLDKTEWQEYFCMQFFDMSNFIITEIPTEYGTRQFLKLVEDGTGPEVPAEYTTRDYYRLNMPAHVIERTMEERAFQSVTIPIPEGQTFENYFRTHLVGEDFNCQAEVSFRTK